MHQRGVIVRDAPGAGIDVVARGEMAFLRGAAEFGIRIATLDRPGTATDAVVEFEHLHGVTRAAEFERGGHPRDACAEDQHRSAFDIAVEFGRACEGGGARLVEAGHRHVHRRGASGFADHRQQVALGDVCQGDLGHGVILSVQGAR